MDKRIIMYLADGCTIWLWLRRTRVLSYRYVAAGNTKHTTDHEEHNVVPLWPLCVLCTLKKDDSSYARERSVAHVAL
jgi:hypothetical protein